MTIDEQGGNYGSESLSAYQTIVEMMFPSELKAYEFFNDYAKRKGFSVRKDKTRTRVNGELCYRRFLCSKAGFRQEKLLNTEDKEREHALTRGGCLARLDVKLQRKTGYWYVSAFVDGHNHPLADEEEVVHLRSHRKINNVKKVEIISLQVAGLRKRQIMDVLEHKEGGFRNVGFVMKDMYNFLAQFWNSITYNGDAEFVLKCMKERKERDTEFFFYYNTDNDGCLTALFWSDVQSRIDYQCFGDVLIFDSTYRVNRYNMPFIPFVGVNHHRSTTIFGCGIVNNETAESYKWLLSTFLTAMYQNRPKSVITDGCPSMAKAIREILPRAIHRVCSWHIEQNMTRHLHSSNHEGFRALLYTNFNPNEFDSRWGDYVSGSTSLRDNEWLKQMYDSRERWAEAYLQNKLFLRMTSNQRSESLNSRLHTRLDAKMCLVDLVRHYEYCLSRIRRNEVKLDCKASQSIPITKTEFVELEKHAAQVYTPTVFYAVRDELACSNNYAIVGTKENGGKKWYVLESNGNVGKKIVVECAGGDLVQNVKCTCKKLECEKIPCRHILRVLVQMNTDVIPPCCVWKRWTKSPKICLPLLAQDSAFGFSDPKESLRVMEMMEPLRLQKKRKGKEIATDAESNRGETTSPVFGVADPKIMVGRGAPKKRFKSFLEKKEKGTRRCGHCRQFGHNKATCLELREK